MPTPPHIATPAHYVTQQALAFGRVGEEAQPVDAASPLPVSERSFTTAVPLTLDEPAPPGARALLVDCSAAGRLAIALSGGGTLSLPVEVGLSILPFAVSSAAAAGTTATATLAVLL